MYSLYVLWNKCLVYKASKLIYSERKKNENKNKQTTTTTN